MNSHIRVSHCPRGRFKEWSRSARSNKKNNKKRRIDNNKDRRKQQQSMKGEEKAEI